MLILFKSLRLCVSAVMLSVITSAQALAPVGPGRDAQWMTAAKQAIGTSATPTSKVWFTIAEGVLSEVYYPDVTTANVQMLQFIVVDPKTKKVETEKDDATHKIKILRPNTLAFQQVNTAKSGIWTITKTYTIGSYTDTIHIDISFQTNKKELKVYVQYDPSLGNSGMYDSGGLQRRSDCSACDLGGHPILASMDEKTGISSKLFFSSEISEIDSSFAGSDGVTQIRKFGKIVRPSITPDAGNIVQTARIDQPSRFIAILVFGRRFDDAEGSMDGISFASSLAEYEGGWSNYVKALPQVEAKYQAQFNMAAMILKALEDKAHPGANIASLSVPWGGGANANENNVGGYHLVWSRDLYHVATAYMALGQRDAANRALDFLFNVQQRSDGSFPQNSWLDGKPFWNSLQMDEIAYPLILAYQLGRVDKATYENHVKQAADFIIKNGPATPQERWEEKGGYSPSTIAAEIAGLVCAAEIARTNGDQRSADLWLKTADNWQANVEKWTATKTGKYSDGNYYLRIAQNGRPDAGEKIELNNGAGTFDEREIVDAGFLELVRLGIKAANDPLIEKSVKVVDQVLKVDTPNGPGFFRYNHDGYGEEYDGRRWNWDGKYSGKGHLWTLLSGERGEYELARYKEYVRSINIGRMCPNGRPCPPVKPNADFYFAAKGRLDNMLSFANDGLMIPEQIWDRKETPGNVDHQFVPDLKFGEGTGSATPLAWSMAQFIRLAMNLKAGRNLETPDVVYDRYVLRKMH